MVHVRNESNTHLGISRVQRYVERYLTNPFLRWILRSSFHWLLSRWFLLVSYEGRSSGQRYEFPVVFHREAERFVVITPRGESVWWKNFQTEFRCTLWVAGTAVPAMGSCVSGDERDEWLGPYFEHYSLFRGLLSSMDTELDDELVVVQFVPISS